MKRLLTVVVATASLWSLGLGQAALAGEWAGVQGEACNGHLNPLNA